MRSVVLILLVVLGIRTAGVLPSHPARLGQGHRCTGLAKALPVSLRYRQEIERQIHLPPRVAAPSLSADLTAPSPDLRTAGGNTFLPYGTALVHLLLRLRL
jgi:hypothetical protein